MRVSSTSFLLGLGLFTAPLAANADVIGAEVGAAYWKQDPSGWVEDADSATQADLDEDLGIGEESGGFFWLTVEHPVPFLPNLKLRHTPMSFDGSGNVSTEFTFQGVTFAQDTPVDSEVQLDQTDVILYYEVMDNVVNLDLGLNVKVVDAQFKVTERDPIIPGDDSAETDFTAPIPLLYARASGELPLTGLEAGVELSAIGYDGNRVVDAQAFLRYHFGMVLGIEGGYRRMELVIDDIDDVSADIDISGPYAAVFADF